MLAAIKQFFVSILIMIGVVAPMPYVAPEPIIVPTLVPTATPTPEPLRSIDLTVSFTSQSPFGEWNDFRQQDACEEASILMAAKWAIKQPILDKQSAKDELLAMYAYQVEQWGNGIDTSAQDSADRLLGGYFQYENYRVDDLDSYEDVVRELMRGNVVVVPTDGRLLGNPNFVNGGPERHMVLVKGYDLVKRQFITHDPGTRQGANYRYDQDVFFNAIRDYETGDHEPILGANKVMISVTSQGP